MKVAHSPEPAEERVVFRDGLGVRERRELPRGEVVEWFHLVADFSAAEALLRERVARLAKFQHVKFSRILGLEPSGKGRGPVLVSTYLPGTRLAEVLEMAGHGLVTFDAGAGLHVTREVLAGLAVLHDSRTVSHGTLAPERVLLTPNGRVVMVEHVLGPAIDRLQRPRHQLWRDWRIPTPPTPGQVKLDIQADLAQAGLLAIAALLGRPVDPEEYPHRLRGLLPTIQDRLAKSPAAGIAGDVVAWLERLAPLDSRRAFTSAREAQQAYEGLVVGHATALGITSARVKGVVAAIAALAPAPAPAVPVEAAPSVQSPAVVVVSPPTVAVPTLAAAPTSAADDEIDIDALLRLEAELEGGSAPGPDRVARAIEEAARVEVAAPSIEALEQERRLLQEQFASLVNSVAPATDEGPRHLIPETPSTSEPLVDERVRWSSMPAADLSDVPAGHDVDVPSPAAPVEKSVPLVEEADVATIGPVNGDPVVEVPAALESEHSDSVDVVARPESDEAAFVVEPIVVMPPEEPAPAAAIESVSADWWKEALPWRDADEAAASDAAAPPFEPVSDELAAAPVDAEPMLLEPAPAPALEPEPEVEPEVAPVSAAAAEQSASVAEDFGYLTLESIEARATAIDEGTDGIGDPPTVSVDASAPFAFVGEEPATLEFSAEVLHDQPLVAEVAEPPVAVDELAELAPDSPASTTVDEAQASPVVANDEAPVADLDPAPSVHGLFEDLRPIMLQDLEPVAEDVGETALLADAAPLEAATALFRHVEAAPQVDDWRHALLSANEQSEAPAAPTFVEPADAGQADAGASEAELPGEQVVLVADALTEVVAAGSQDATEVVPDAPPVEVSSGAADAVLETLEPAAPAADIPPPELLVVEQGTEGHVLVDLLPAETREDLATAAVEDLEEASEAPEHEPHATAVDDAAGLSAGRKKRRRSRRKKGVSPSLVAPVVEASTVEVVPVAPVPDVPVAPPAPVVAAPMVIAPVPPPEERDAAAEKAALHAVVAARMPSLLEREVPRWTPPTNLGALRPPVVQPTAHEIAASHPEPAPADTEAAVRAGGDEWGTGAFPAATVASGEVNIPSPPAAPPVPRPAVPAPVPVPAAVAPLHEAAGTPDRNRRFDSGIRAVGLPDPVDDPRSTRMAITTAADAIGETVTSGRHSWADPRATWLPEPARKGVNWRRLMAAAALLVAFNGVGFAAWWWVQPGARGTLVVETGRSGVEVFVDGTSMGRTPFRGEVKPGRHTLQLRQGSVVRNMPVEISDGVVTTQTVEWLPNGAGRGALQVSSTPSGADLFVNGKARGKTPVLLEDLLEGDQQLMVRSEAGTVNQTATVVAGETTPVEVKVFAGWVLVDSEYEVDLSLNGKKIGASMDGQILLPPGPYRLRAENRSFGIDQPITFTVEPGAVTRLSLNVPPAWYDAPEGAEVIVDGASVGTGPGRVSIAPGTHEVVVRAVDGSQKHFSGIVKANRAFEP